MIEIELKGSQELQDGTHKGTFIFSEEFEITFMEMKRTAKKENRKVALVLIEESNKPETPEVSFDTVAEKMQGAYREMLALREKEGEKGEKDVKLFIEQVSKCEDTG